MNIYIKISFFGFLCFLTSACASVSNVPTAAQQRYNSTESALNSLSSQSVACLNAITAAHSESDTIFSPDNKSRIKKENKKSETSRLNEFMQCREHEYEQTKNHPDYYVRSFAPILKESIDLRNDVYKKYLGGEITGSEGYASLKNISEYLGSKWDSNNQQIVGSLNQQHFQQLQAEAAMWQAMGSTFQNHNQQQQAYQKSYNQQQVNRPVHTQCRWDAGVMNCSSYQY